MSWTRSTAGAVRSAAVSIAGRAHETRRVLPAGGSVTIVIDGSSPAVPHATYESIQVASSQEPLEYDAAEVP